ncbi:hypothetical protein Bca4012_089926 [Brassica carinata]|uniref:GRF-type domain-containing protein n=1 Tax=Brassica carinata TaxID=52824 RepID=A0A8X7P8C7_BRACI|nr:uncharacterized protein At1g43920, Chloroplastic-like [Brassica napus]KAG2247106.1 hypothetical protein Bca52824_086734 [Brassica carinata]
MENVHGIPRQCHCGSQTIVLTSKTKKNPGRRFFRCGTTSGTGHVFKWVDEANSEELGLLADKQATFELDLIQLKQELIDMKKDISEIVEVLEGIKSKV